MKKVLKVPRVLRVTMYWKLQNPEPYSQGGKRITPKCIYGLNQHSELQFFQNTQKCFAHYSATKYRLAILYSKQTAGYPLSPHIKTIDVAFLRS